MRNNIKPVEAQEIGCRIRVARKRNGKSVNEIANAIGVHYSQVIRYEQGTFKTVSHNVRKVCIYLKVKHKKLVLSNASDQSVRERFGAVLDAIPESAMAFSTLFDILEASIRSNPPRTRKLSKQKSN